MTTQRLQIDRLYEGTSDQHDAKRAPGQVEEALNIRLDIANGATRRNGTDILEALDLRTDRDWLIESFKGRWIVALCYDDLRIFDAIDGEEMSVINSVGDYNYLSTATAKQDIRTAALLDTLVILNRNVETAFNASASYPVSGTVTTYDKLFEEPEDDTGDDPTVVPDGGHFEVLEDWKGTRAGFYQKGRNDAGAIEWTIVAPPQDDNAVPDPTTLPHRLVHDVDAGTFTYEPCPWRSRLSGSDATNPAPSWAGEKLEAIAAHQGRFFFAGDSYLTAGEVAAPRRSVFNLYDYNVDVPTDSDRIDYAITDSRVASVLYMESVGADLALVCENGVVVYTSGADALTAFNGRDFTIAELPASEEARPGVSAGNLFVFDDNDRVHWFIYAGEGLIPQGEINAHRPDILQGETVIDLFAIQDTLYVVCESGSVKVHERYVRPEGNLLSAWSELAFFERPIFFGTYNDKLKIMTTDPSAGYALLDYEHRQPFYGESVGFEVCLDRREDVVGVYDFSTNRTAFEHTGRSAALASSLLFDPESNQSIEPIGIQGNRFFVNGNKAGVKTIGFRYESRLTLSKLWAGLSSVLPLLSQVNVLHKDSTDYILEVEEQGETAIRSPWTSTLVGVNTFGTVVAETGISKHLAMGDARDTAIRITSDSAGYFQVPAIEMRVRTRGIS